MDCIKRLEPKINKKEFAQIFLMLLFVFFMVNTNMCSSSVQKTIIVFLVCATFISLKNFTSFKREISTKIAFVFSVFEVYILLFSAAYYSPVTAVNTVLSQLVYFGGIFLFFILTKRLSMKYFSILVVSILALWLFADIKLLLLCRKMPNIARFIVAGQVDPKISCSVGAPYALAESSCFIVIALLNLVINKRYKTSRRFKVLTFIAIAVMGLTVYEVQSTITTLIMLLGCTAAFLFNVIKGKDGLDKRKQGIIILIIVLLLCVFLMFKECIGTLLIKLFVDGDSVFASRLVELGRTLSNEGTSHDLSVRVELTMQSVTTFLENPIFGNLYIKGRVSGGHCAILDLFSDYGLVGGIPFLMLFILYFRKLKMILPNYDAFIWTPLFVMSWLNPIALYQTYFAILFVVPSLYYMFEKYEVKKKTEQAEIEA